MKLNINKFKFALAALFLLGVQTMSKACEACELQQPKITRGLTHGTGPQSPFDWVWVAIITVITIATFYLSVKYLFKPGERDKNHIKNNILNY